MGSHGALADEQLIRNLLVRKPLRHQAQHLHLPVRQRLLCRWQLGASLDLPHELASDRRVHRRLALVYVANGVEKVTGRRILQQIPVCPRLDGREDFLILGEAGQHQNSRAWILFFDLANRLQPSLARHHQVEENHVRLQCASLLDSLKPIRGLAHQLHPCFCVDQCPQALSHHRVVIGDQNLDLPAHEGISTLTLTVVPSPGAETRANDPPNLSARVRMLTSPMPPLSLTASGSNPRPSSLTSSVRPCPPA